VYICRVQELIYKLEFDFSAVTETLFWHIVLWCSHLIVCCSELAFEQLKVNKLMLRSVVVINTVSTTFRVRNSVRFTFLLIFTTRKLVAFSSMMIIPTLRP